MDMNKKVNVPPQIREAFTSAMASSGDSKQEIQMLKSSQLAHARGYADCRLLQTPTAERLFIKMKDYIVD